MQPEHEKNGGMQRALGKWDAMAVVVGAIIGVGIFFTPTDVAKLAGSVERALFVWALGGVVALLGAFTFAELGRRYPLAGGQYQVIRDAWGPFAGFLYVFCVITAIEAGTCAIIALICVDNLSVVLGVELAGTIRALCACGLVVGLTGTNMLGVRYGAWVQNLTVIAKVGTLFVVGAIAISLGGGDLSERGGEAPSGLLFAALLPALFSYGGWQQLLWMGGEVRDAEKNLPFAIIGGVVLVVGVYLLAAWSFFALLGFEQVVGAKALAAEAVGAVVPGWGARLVAAAVCASAFGVLNVQFMTGPRLTWALAKDGLFFSIFAQVNSETRTPVWAVGLLGLMAGLVLLFGAETVGALTAWVVAVDALFFALTGLALVRFCWQEQKIWSWLVPGAFAALELAAVGGAVLDPSVQGSAIAGLCWMGVGAVLYGLKRVL